MRDDIFSDRRVLFDAVREVAGEDGILALQRGFGGADLTVPGIRVTRGSAFSAALGFETAAQVVAKLRVIGADDRVSGGFRVYIPQGPLSVGAQAQRRAIDAIEQGMTGPEAARYAQLSVRTIYRLRAICGIRGRGPALGAVAQCKTRSQIQRSRRRRILKAVRLGLSRKAIVADLGVSSSTVAQYLKGLRKRGHAIDFGKGPKPGTKLDGSAWRGRIAQLLRAYAEGLTRDEMAERLSMNRRRLSEELRRLAKDEGRPFPLAWKPGPRARAAA